MYVLKKSYCREPIFTAGLSNLWSWLYPWLFNFGYLTKPGCPSLVILVRLLNQQVRRNDVCNRNYKQWHAFYKYSIMFAQWKAWVTNRECVNVLCSWLRFFLLTVFLGKVEKYSALLCPRVSRYQLCCMSESLHLFDIYTYEVEGLYDTKNE